jgi:L-rhamnose mutarotase
MLRSSLRGMTSRKVEEGPQAPAKRGPADARLETRRSRVWARPRHPSPSPKCVAMPRVCFQLQVKRDRIEEYKTRHAAVWPDMLQALHQTGWHNYSLFLREDGLLIGYFETPDSLSAAQAGMAATEVNARWQAEMGELFEQLDGLTPDEGFLVLEEVFHLEDQLGTDSQEVK